MVSGEGAWPAADSGQIVCFDIQPLFCQGRATEMQDELVQRVRLAFLLLLLVSLLLLHRFLETTRGDQSIGSEKLFN